MTPLNVTRQFSRRQFLSDTALGFGSMALLDLMQREGALQAAPGHSVGTADPFARPHQPAKAKSVIMLLQNGAPSQMDMFDPKPELQRRDGQKASEDVESFQPGSEADILMASPFTFHKRGQCGMELSNLIPHLGSVADDLCLIRSMWNENNNHPQGLRTLCTGKTFLGRPTLGSWVSYALGSENQNLPSYVVLRDPDGYTVGGVSLWTNGWLPATHGGTEIQSRGTPVLNLQPASSLPDGVQPRTLQLIQEFNQERRRLYPEDSRLEARIQQYELAARMQRTAEKLLDVSSETAETQAMYGMGSPETDDYGRRCLMARRLVEAGVRFILVTVPIKYGAMPWDQHNNLQTDLPKICKQVDQPSAALISDLKRRGLLDETIVLWSGEFGRLPISQSKSGRDHNRFGFSLLLAGGGFKAGHIHGSTDDFGYRATRNPVSCPDLLATILHQLGLDHEQLTYSHDGRDETLTDSAVTNAKVVREIVA